MANSVLRSAGIGNSNTGATFLFHETGNQLRVYFGIFSDSCLGNMPPINFRVELKACFCRIKWLTTEITFIWRENRHFLLVNGHRTAWTVFSRPVGVTIRGNLIGLPLLRVVNHARLIRQSWQTERQTKVRQAINPSAGMLRSGLTRGHLYQRKCASGLRHGYKYLHS